MPFWQDVRYALLRLVEDRSLTFLAAAALGLGIGSDLVFGAGGGPLFWGSKRLVDYSWDPVREIRVATDVDGPHEARVGFLYHFEVSGSRAIRDGLKVRYGVTVTLLLWVPLVVQPMVSGVWEF